MQLPSNKVGLILIIVVLFVSGSIIFSKFEFKKPLPPLESVELVIGRNTSTSTRQNWLDEFNQTTLMRPVPRGPLIEGGNLDPDSLTSKASIDLFSEYLILKQKGILSQEDEIALTTAISQKINQESSLKTLYSISDISVTQSTKDTVKTYGERVAQVTIEHFLQMDAFKNMRDTSSYLQQIANQHQSYIDQLIQIRVPSVVQDAHVELINRTHDTKAVFEALLKAEQDPVASLVVVTQYQARQNTENDLYTLLAQYFKNNGIIFDTESVVRFWNTFE